MRDLRRAFYRLAQVGEEGQFTRRVARWSRMPASCKAVLQRFVDQRLLVSDTANGEPDPQRRARGAVPRLGHAERLAACRTARRWRSASQIEEAAAEWQAENRGGEPRLVGGTHPGRGARDRGQRRFARRRCGSETVDAFLGPTDPKQLEALPGLDAGGRDIRQRPLRRRLASAAQPRGAGELGVRLALLGDRRKGVGLREDGLPDIDWRRDRRRRGDDRDPRQPGRSELGGRQTPHPHRRSVLDGALSGHHRPVPGVSR